LITRIASVLASIEYSVPTVAVAFYATTDIEAFSLEFPPNRYAETLDALSILIFILAPALKVYF
jgi:hypothetical protein